MIFDDFSDDPRLDLKSYRGTIFERGSPMRA